MPKTLAEMMATLPKERQQEVEADFQEMYTEYLSLKELRKAQEMTQVELAKKLGIQQAGVARIEKRTDLLLSTLKSYVAGLGGQLNLTVQFPGGAVVSLDKLSENEK